MIQARFLSASAASLYSPFGCETHRCSIFSSFVSSLLIFFVYFRTSRMQLLCLSSLLFFILLHFSSLPSPFTQRLLLPEDSLLKCVTLNWKENSVKVQSVVHEREKRKAKEVATFFFVSDEFPTEREERELSSIISSHFTETHNWRCALSAEDQLCSLREETDAFACGKIIRERILNRVVVVMTSLSG